MIVLLFLSAVNWEQPDEVHEEYELLKRAYESEVLHFDQTFQRRRLEITTKRTL